MKKLAIFDLDGTILDTLGDLCDATNRALKKQGFAELTIEDTRRNIGNGVLNLLKRSAPEGTPDELLKEMHKEFLVDYKANCAIKTKPYDGVIDMLNQLKNQGVRLAVVSNKFDAAVQDLMEQYFPGVFDFIAGEQDGYRKKPAPDLLLKAMKELSCTAEETVFLGDGDTDIASSIAAGIPCICVLWGFRDRAFLEECGGTIFAEHVDDLTDIITKM